MTRSAESFRALVIEHERVTPVGIIGDWLEGRSADVDLLRIDVEDGMPSPRAYDLVVSLGSEFAAFDDSLPWIEREKHLLLQAIEGDVPVLGVCFGAQLLARVLGGESFRANAAEIGWLPVRSRDPELVSEGPWFQWHFDSFSIPPGARLLAESDVGPQVFAIGRSLGVQFHPEVTPAIMDEWVRIYRHELDAEGVGPDQLLDQTESLEESSREIALQLLDGYFEQVAGLHQELTR